ncbi:MAG: DUF5671 domain-containing protein [bacterium]|nr:DUF5671 domain-containing protein [bacterium]
MEQKHTTRPLEVFFAVGSLVLTFIVAFATGGLLFSLVDNYIADPLADLYRMTISADSIRYTMSILIITFPLLLLARHYLKRTADARGNQLTSRVYDALTYAVLFIAGGTIVGDLVAVVFNFLRGEATSRFMLKALIVLLIAGIVFKYYLTDRRRREFGFIEHTMTVKAIEWFTVALVIFSVVFGFIITGGPGQARLERYDSVRMSNLQQIEQAVNWYADTFNGLPETLAVVAEVASERAPYYAEMRLSDPATNESYGYKSKSINSEKGEVSYELCASFDVEGSGERFGNRWDKHAVGKNCETITYTIATYLYDGLKPVPVR